MSLLTTGEPSRKLMESNEQIKMSQVMTGMKAEAKDYEMQRFVKGETKIMVTRLTFERFLSFMN